MSNQKGFTLIELMIALSITGVLAAIAIPYYMDYVGRSQVVEGFSATDGLRSEIAIWTWEHKRFPDAEAVSNIGRIGRQAHQLEGKYIADNGITVEKDTGVIIILFDAGNIVNKTLKISPVINVNNNEQIVSWKCSGTISRNKLPLTCQ